MALPYADRSAAGDELGIVLGRLHLTDPLVLGVPRGGVAVAARVASALDASLDVIVVRKLGAPSNEELAIGAVGATGDVVIDDDLVASLRVADDYLGAEIARQQAEALRRRELYRPEAGPPLEGRDVIVVDDGIATGSTVRAAGTIIRSASPRSLTLAVPVAPAESVARAQQVYDQVIAVHTPEPFYAVGQWYRDFHQVSDEEVSVLLAHAS